jgi:opacity protein-like surface antigen
MKKISILLLIVSLIISSSQIQAQTKISLGARAGLSFSNLSFDPNVPSQITKSSRTGFKVGGLAEISFIPMLAVQIEPMFSTGGSELSGQIFNNGFSSVNGKITYKISYIEIPILLKFKIPLAGPVSPYVFAGPNIGFIMSSKESDEPSGYASSETDLKDFVSTINFALDFGAGAGFKVTPRIVLMLDIRYSLGMSNVLNDKGKQNFGSNQSIKSNAFQIVAGVMFTL